MTVNCQFVISVACEEKGTIDSENNRPNKSDMDQPLQHTCWLLRHHARLLCVAHMGSKKPLRQHCKTYPADVPFFNHQD